jgi:hypothetical protein
LFFAIILVSTFPYIAESAEKCGVIESLDRTVFALRNGREFELETGSSVFQGDMIKTGRIGNADIRLIDGTVAHIGPTSEVLLVSVVFDVRISQMQIAVDRGNVSLKMGSIPLVNPRGVRLTTPRALIYAGDSDLTISVSPSSEEIRADRLFSGNQISIYNSNAREIMNITAQNSVLSIDSEDAMTITEQGAGNR